jgi:hypothetical protein
MGPEEHYDVKGLPATIPAFESSALFSPFTFCDIHNEGGA